MSFQPSLGVVARSARIAIVASVACSGAEAGPSAAVRDSAGVTIVENPATLAERELWSVVADPVVEIGVLEGEDAYQLSGVGAATRLSDGRIALTNGGTQEVRFYGPDGTHRLSVGREGEGPGEFRGLGALLRLPGDSLATYDWSLRRVSFFDTAGTFLHSVMLDYPSSFPVAIGRLPDGSWLATRAFTFVPQDEGSDVVRDTVPLLRFGPGGALRDSVGRFPGTEFYVRTARDEAFANRLPFGRTMEAVVAGDRFCAGPSDRFEITCYPPTGTPDLVIRLIRDPVPITGDEIEAHKAEQLAASDPQWRPRLERLYQDIPFHTTLPAFADLQADPDGNLWVLDYNRPGDDTRRWTVFAPDGRALGSVTTPPGLRVLEIGQDYVLGVWQDELDVEHVRMYELRRGT